MPLSIQCSECKAIAMVVKYSRIRGAERLQKLTCRACGHKSERLIPNEKSPENRRPHSDRRFSDQAIFDIRRRGAANSGNWAQIARDYGTSRELVRQVVHGLIYRDLLPDDFRRPPGPADPKCDYCSEWLGPDSEQPCRLGVPDPVIEGVGFARDCEFYETKRGS